jgi:predicted ATP-binding protein involved in virulence
MGGIGNMIVPLQSVQIENFRGIRELALELHPRATVLFGANAAGKTTIIDALAIALGCVVSRVPKSKGRDFAKTGDIRVPWKERPEVSEKKGVECPYTRIAVTSKSELQWDVSRFRSVQDRASRHDFIGTQALNDELDSLVKTALNARLGELTPPLPLVAAYGTERAMVDVPLRERDFRSEFHRFGSLDLSLQTRTRFKTVFEWFRLMEDEERRERERLNDFKHFLPELQWVRRAIENADLRCLRPRVETRPLRMLVNFKHNGETEPLDIAALSDGFRTHFALIVDMARRMVQLNPSPDTSDAQRGTNSPAVVLIDEIDLHLDPPWQARVVQGLQNAFPNTQFILTTHSEQILGSVGSECVRKLRWGDGEILVEPVPFAQGSTGERILIDLMDAPARVPGPVTSKLKEYLRLVENDEGNTTDAQTLRRELDVLLPNDPQLHQADIEMQRRNLISKLGSEFE